MSEIAVRNPNFSGPLAAEHPAEARAGHLHHTEARTGVAQQGGAQASCGVPCEATPGLVALPTGRIVWWTGRVAIGLRYQPAQRSADAELSQSAAWIQSLLLH